ncbi:MAG: hypothetical protein LUG18_15980 [Candidatus Azobacteroides sp.]|nr:hypothetical protein [Candidatus Azobacteroides sp.]
MSNRDRQIQKDIENKYAQAREEYSKNKQLYKEIKTQEKAGDTPSRKKEGDENKNMNDKENQEQ